MVHPPLSAPKIHELDGYQVGQCTTLYSGMDRFIAQLIAQPFF